MRQTSVHHQAVAVFHQQMSGEGQFSALAVGLAGQPRIQIRGRGMGLVRALLVMEIAFAVATGGGSSSLPSLRRKLFIDPSKFWDSARSPTPGSAYHPPRNARSDSSALTRGCAGGGLAVGLATGGIGSVVGALVGGGVGAAAGAALPKPKQESPPRAVRQPVINQQSSSLH